MSVCLHILARLLTLERLQKLMAMLTGHFECKFFRDTFFEGVNGQGVVLEGVSPVQGQKKKQERILMKDQSAVMPLPGSRVLPGRLGRKIISTPITASYYFISL